MVSGNLKQLESQLAKEKEKLKQLGKIADVGLLNKATELNSNFVLNVAQLAAKHNAGYARLLGSVKAPSFKNSVDSLVWQIGRANELAEKTQSKIDLIEQKIKSAKQKMYEDAYQKAKELGAPVDAILLAAFDDLGDDIPPSLGEEVMAARVRKNNDSNSSQFDKLFYAGEYREALRSLTETNRSTVTVRSSMGAGFSDAEIFRLYDKATNPNRGGLTKPVESSHNPLIADQMNEVMASRMKPLTFGAQKIAEGYVALAMQDTDAYDKQKNPLGIAEVMIAKKQQDGTLSVFIVDANGNVNGRPKESIINMQSAQSTADTSAEMESNFEKLMVKMPSFAKLREAGKIIQSRVTPLQKLFTAGESGKKTADFAKLAKGYAREIQSSGALKQMRESMPEVRADLALLKQLPQGYRDKFESQIYEMEKSLTQMADLVAGGKIEYFCEQVLNPAFSEDDLWSWAIKEGIVILTAIGVAVAAMFLTMGTGGVAGLAIAAAAGTAGGMVGAEVGYRISEKVGEWKFGKGYSNKSTLGKYLAQEKMIDPVTGQLREIDGIDLVKTYGQQFVVGFMSTFVLMGLGQVAGKALSRFAAKHGASEGMKGRVAELINKIPRLQAQHVDLLSKGGMKNILKRMGEEYLQELGEEGVEQAAEKIGPVSGFLASMYNCLTPGRVKYMLGKQHIAAESVTSTEAGAVSVFSFDENRSAEVASQVKKSFEKEGFTVTQNEDGSITCEKKMTLKDKSEVTARTVFNPTKESVAVRDLMGTGSAMDGKSQLKDLYGVKQVGENKYEFGTDKPEGKIDIKNYLAKQGFVITENEDGTFSAQKGKEPAVLFGQSGKSNLEERALAEQLSPEVFEKFKEVRARFEASAAELQSFSDRMPEKEVQLQWYDRSSQIDAEIRDLRTEMYATDTGKKAWNTLSAAHMKNMQMYNVLKGREKLSDVRKTISKEVDMNNESDIDRRLRTLDEVKGSVERLRLSPSLDGEKTELLQEIDERQRMLKQRLVELDVPAPLLPVEERVAQLTSHQYLTNSTDSDNGTVDVRIGEKGKQGGKMVIVGTDRAVFADSNRELLTNGLQSCVGVFIKGPNGNALIHFTPTTNLGYAMPGHIKDGRPIDHDHLSDTMSKLVPELTKLGPVDELQVAVVGNTLRRARPELENIAQAFRTAGVKSAQATEVPFSENTSVAFLPQKPDSLFVMSGGQGREVKSQWVPLDNPQEEVKKIATDDATLVIRAPRDRVDIPLFPQMEGPRGMGLTEISNQVKRMLVERGVTEIQQGKPIFIEYSANDPSLTDEMRSLMPHVDKIGFMVIGSLEPIMVGGRPRVFLNVFPVCEVKGQQYRILGANKWKGASKEQINESLNSIFVPSEIHLDADGSPKILMPILSNIEHPSTITQAEFDDFMTRLRSVKVDVSPDICTLDEMQEETNMVRINGRLYLSDAGDVIGRNFVDKVGDAEMRHIEEPLRTRIVPDSRRDNQDARARRSAKAEARVNDPAYAARVEANLGILDRPEGRGAFENSLRENGVLALGEPLSDDDFNAVMAMHSKGGSGAENLGPKRRAAEERTKAIDADTTKTPAEKEIAKARWVRIYNHALEEGFAGARYNARGQLVPDDEGFVPIIQNRAPVRPAPAFQGQDTPGSGVRLNEHGRLVPAHEISAPARAPARLESADLSSLNAEGARVIEGYVDDMIAARSRAQARANGRPVLAKDVERELHASTRKMLSTSVDAGDPIIRAVFSSVRDAAQRHGFEVTSGGHINFGMDGLQYKRKAYLNPSFRDIPRFTDALVGRLKKEGIAFGLKVNGDSVVFAGPNPYGGGEILNQPVIGTEHNIMPIYFKNDADFSRFLQILPEIEAAAATSLNAYGQQEARRYGHAAGGKVLFGIDIPNDSYDGWFREATFSPVLGSLIRTGGDRQTAIAVLRDTMGEIRPEIAGNTNDFLILPQ